MPNRRKRYTAQFKWKVVLEALQSPRSDVEIARAYGISPVTLSGWKRRAVETGAELYAGREQSKKSQKRIADLERLLGHKEVEIALLKNFLGGP